MSASIIAEKMLAKKRADVFDEEYQGETYADRIEALFLLIPKAVKVRKYNIVSEAIAQALYDRLADINPASGREAVKRIVDECGYDYRVIRSVLSTCHFYDGKTGGDKGYYSVLGAMEIDDYEDALAMAKYERWRIIIVDSVLSVIKKSIHIAVIFLIVSIMDNIISNIIPFWIQAAVLLYILLSSAILFYIYSDFESEEE